MPRPLLAILLGLSATLVACGEPSSGTCVNGGCNIPCRIDAECTADERCIGSVCRVIRYEPECDAGALHCNGDAVERCGSDRLWTLAENCPLGCLAGECIAPICTPLEQRCRGRLLETCRGDGALWITTDDCSAGCDPETLACRPPSCASGEKRCDGRNIMRCNARRTGWDLLEPCATFCDPTVVACAPGTVCTDRDRRCSGKDLLGCGASGASWVVVAECEERCDALTLECAPFVCSPGATTCFGDVPASCNLDGSGWVTAASCANGCDLSAGACL